MTSFYYQKCNSVLVAYKILTSSLFKVGANKKRRRKEKGEEKEEGKERGGKRKKGGEEIGEGEHFSFFSVGDHFARKI